MKSEGLIKALLLAEVIVCFFPISLMLLVGIVSLPLQLLADFETGDLYSIFDYMPIVGGYLGMRALMALVRKIRHPEQIAPSPLKVLIFALFGYLSLLFLYIFTPTFGPDVNVLMPILFVWMPILCAFHLFYLGRGYLFFGKNTAAEQ